MSEKRYTVEIVHGVEVIHDDKEGSHLMNQHVADRLNALEAERDRYKAALEYIESTPTTWTLGVDENMERLRTIATQALGGGDE